MLEKTCYFLNKQLKQQILSSSQIFFKNNFFYPPNPSYLHVVEHSLDDLLAPGELPLDLVAVCLGVLWMEVVYPLRLVLDPALDVVKLRVGGLGVGVDLAKGVSHIF